MSYAFQYRLRLLGSIPCLPLVNDLPRSSKSNAELLTALLADFKKFFAHELGSALKTRPLGPEAEERLRKHFNRLVATKKLFDRENRLHNC